MKNKLLLVFTLFILTNLVLIGSDGEIINLKEKIQVLEKFLSKFARADEPGFSVAITYQNKVVFKDKFGLASIEHQKPITNETKFNIGSVAKQFTGMAVAMLVDQDKLDLDQNTQFYLQKMPEVGKKITLRHLIHHTSGLRDWIEGLQLAGRRAGDAFTHHDIIQNFVYRQRELNFTPGEEFTYCNTGYSLLAEIVTETTGQPFPEWMAENIFTPLGMNNSEIITNIEKPIRSMADAYFFQRETGKFTRSVLNGTLQGAGGIVSTLDDMIKWVLNFEKREIGSAKIFQMMAENGKLNNGEVVNYAFGQIPYDLHGIKLFAHGGSGAGWYSCLIRCPEYHLSMILLANSTKLKHFSIFPLLDIFFRDLYKKKQAIKSVQETVYKKIDLNPSKLKQYIGRYKQKSNVFYTIFIRNKQLWFSQSGKKAVQLIPYETDKFFTGGKGALIYSFSIKESKTILSIIDPGLKKPQIMEREELETQRSNDDFKLGDYCGKYYSEELNATYALKIISDNLFASNFWGKDIVLEHTCLDYFNGNQPWAREVKFERDQKNQIIGFRVYGSRIAGVLFKKMNCSCLNDH